MSKQTDNERAENPAFAVLSYRIESAGDGSKEMRIVFFNNTGHKDVIAVMEMKSSAAYDFSADILKHYDQLEGIK